MQGPVARFKEDPISPGNLVLVDFCQFCRPTGYTDAVNGLAVDVCVRNCSTVARFDYVAGDFSGNRFCCAETLGIKKLISQRRAANNGLIPFSGHVVY